MHFDKQTIILAAVSILVLGLLVFRLNRMRQMRPLKIEWLWVTPVLMVAMTGWMLWGLGMQGQVLHGLDFLWVSLAVVVGALIGWYRGRMMQIHVDPETHALNQQASPIAILFLIGILAIRRVADFALQGEAKAWHISLILLTSAPVFLAVGMLTATRVEMFIRARRLLGEARAAKAA